MIRKQIIFVEKFKLSLELELETTEKLCSFANAIYFFYLCLLLQLSVDEFRGRSDGGGRPETEVSV